MISLSFLPPRWRRSEAGSQTGVRVLRKVNTFGATAAEPLAHFPGSLLDHIALLSESPGRVASVI